MLSILNSQTATAQDSDQAKVEVDLRAKVREEFDNLRNLRRMYNLPSVQGKASTQSFSNFISGAGKVINLLPDIIEIISDVKDIVNGQARAQQEELMTPEKFFQICCQIVMAQSEGEDISMIELCRRCCQVAEQLLDAGQGMTTDQFMEFCSSVAKEMMGQAKPPVAVDGAKAQGSDLLKLLLTRG